MIHIGPITSSDRSVAPALGALYERHQLIENATSLYVHAIRNHPDLAGLQNALGGILASENRLREALVLFATASRLEPANHNFLNNVAVTCEKLGLTQQAARYYAAMANTASEYAEIARDRLKTLEREAVTTDQH